MQPSLTSSESSHESRPATPAEAGNAPGVLDGLLDPGVFKALGDPTRARLVACIARCGRGCSVKEVSACCSVDLSVVSRHLSGLEAVGVLASEREGRVVRYRVKYTELGAMLRGLADAFDACVADRAQGEGGTACCGETDGCC